MLSPTGRTCTVILRRHVPKTKEEGGDDDEDCDGNVVESDFEMIEGKEQEGISEWCRKYSKHFGRPSTTAVSTAKTPASTLAPSSSAKGKGKARATDEDMEVDSEGGTHRFDLSNNPMAEDEGDLDDDNYTGSDSEVSEDSDSEDSGDGDGSAEDSEGEDSDADGEGEGEESRPEPESEEAEDIDEGSMDPKHHPLLRPGAMPKRVSKTVLNTVAGMVGEEFGMTAHGGSDEEDELDDDEL
jgi:hypothetical protein